MDCSLPGFSHRIFQVRVLEWVAISFSKSSTFVVGIDVMWVQQVWDARSRDQITISSETLKVSPNGWLLGPDEFLWAWLRLEGLLCFISLQSVCVCVCVCVSRSVVSNSPIPWAVAHQAPRSMRILQARILEWVAMPSSRGYSQCRDQTWVSCVAGRLFTIWATREAPLKPLPISSLSPLEQRIWPSAHWSFRMRPWEDHSVYKKA